MTQATNTRYEEYKSLTYVRGCMVVIWHSGMVYQVFTGPARKEVLADAQHYIEMLRRGML